MCASPDRQDDGFHVKFEEFSIESI